MILGFLIGTLACGYVYWYGLRVFAIVSFIFFAIGLIGIYILDKKIDNKIKNSKNSETKPSYPTRFAETAEMLETINLYKEALSEDERIKSLALKGLLKCDCCYRTVLVEFHEVQFEDDEEHFIFCEKCFKRKEDEFPIKHSIKREFNIMCNEWSYSNGNN